MSLEGATAALGIPESLVQRSAEARAAETGQSVDEILAAWAGGEAVAAAAPETVAVEETVPEPVEEQPTQVEPAAAVVVEEPAPVAAGVTTRAPAPAEVTAGEASHLPEVITVPTAGIKERTNFVIPKWLTAVMLVIPLFALFALGGATTGTCGEATELETDVVTGEIVNCDGTEFTGSEIGGGGTDYVALGGDIYDGSAVAGVNCAGCHGVNGQGSGAFPPLTGVLTTFGACEDHIAWVSAGSLGWPDSTYGDTAKPVAGGMPGFSGTLTDEQVAAVTVFERVRFGGEDPDAALIDCGLAEPEGEEDPGTEGEGGTTIPEDTEAAAGRSS